LIIALVVLSGLTAFAPAPFPRMRRESNTAVSLTLLQGKWKRVSTELIGLRGEKRKEQFTGYVRVEGKVWSFLETNGKVNTRYTVDIDGKRKPAFIDFYSGTGRGIPFLFGLIRRDSDVVQVLFCYQADAQDDRARSFDRPPPGWRLLTLERVR
jgi:hypothetical protein